MTGTDALAKSIAKSLACSIDQYKAQYRRPPERIFAELGSVYALKMEPCCEIDKFGRVSFMGIPVVPIGRDGLEIYLCGERVEIHITQN